jgi:2-phosphosulfolactate phosphatase
MIHPVVLAGDLGEHPLYAWIRFIYNHFNSTAETERAQPVRRILFHPLCRCEEARAMETHAHFLPELTNSAALEGSAAVVIDVLRATTTIVHALAAGATEVIPCPEVDEARQIAARLGQDAVLGGERGGVRIPGFHLGNSPDEYTTRSIGGKTLVFTTTNGTRAMRICGRARRVLIGAFVNLSAIGRALADEPVVHLVCAGTQNEITREDVLLAGAIVEVLSSLGGARRNDQAEIALGAWQNAATHLSDREPLSKLLRDSRGGRNLIDIGHGSDIELAAHVDRFDFAPELDVAAWRITSLGPRH